MEVHVSNWFPKFQKKMQHPAVWWLSTCPRPQLYSWIQELKTVLWLNHVFYRWVLVPVVDELVVEVDELAVPLKKSSLARSVSVRHNWSPLIIIKPHNRIVSIDINNKKRSCSVNNKIYHFMADLCPWNIIIIILMSTTSFCYLMRSIRSNLLWLVLNFTPVNSSDFLICCTVQLSDNYFLTNSMYDWELNRLSSSSFDPVFFRS